MHTTSGQQTSTLPERNPTQSAPGGDPSLPGPRTPNACLWRRAGQRQGGRCHQEKSRRGESLSSPRPFTRGHRDRRESRPTAGCAQARRGTRCVWRTALVLSLHSSRGRGWDAKRPGNGPDHNGPDHNGAEQQCAEATRPHAPRSFHRHDRTHLPVTPAPRSPGPRSPL